MENFIFCAMHWFIMNIIKQVKINNTRREQLHEENEHEGESISKRTLVLLYTESCTPVRSLQKQLKKISAR